MTDKPKSTFARRVRAAKPRPKRFDIRDDVVTGLILRVLPTGTRTYTLGACAVENFHGTVPHLTLFSMGKYGTIRHNFSTIGKILDLIFHHGQSKTSYRASS